MSKRFTLSFILTTFYLFLSAQVVTEIKSPENNSEERQLLYEKIKSQTSQSVVILKGARPGIHISSLESSYCSSVTNDDIEPDNWEATAIDIIWRVYTIDGGVEVSHPDWFTISGSGTDKILHFNPTLVPVSYYGKAIVFSYIQTDGTGGVATDYDYTYVYKTPSIFDFGANSTICSGSAATLTLSSSEIGMEYFLFRDGIQVTVIPISGDGNPIDFTINQAGTYTVQARNNISSGCTNIMNGSPVVTLHPRPTSVISGSSTICAGESRVITVNLTGTAPWQLTYTNGTTPTTVTVNSSPYTFTVSPATTTTYTVTSLTDVNCSALAGDMTGSAVITVNPRPTSVISGSASICTGESTTITVNLTGTAPWELIYSDGTTPTTVSVNSSPYTFNVSPSTTTTYTVTSLKDVSCSSLPGDMTGSAVVTVYPRPTSVLSGSPTVCSGSAATLNVILTGTAPWQISYSDGVTINTVTALSSPYNLVVTPTTTSTYTITALTDARCSAQAGDMTGSALVTVNPRPTSVISGGATICNGESATLTFNLTGTAPWQLTYSNGTTPTTVTVNSSPHTIDVTPTTTTTYTVTGLSDANCSALAGDMTGSAIVTVNQRPTSVLSGSSVICNGSSATLNVVLTGTAPWQITYFDGTSSNTVTANSSPYSLVVNPTTTTTYTITGLTDANCTALPSDLTGSATITVNPRPTAVISGSSTICANESRVITVNLTGTAPWQLTYTDGTTPTTVTVNSSPYTFTVSPATTTTYTVTSLTNVNCSALPGDMTGSAVVTVNPRPTSVISGNASICTGESTTITVNLTGTAPWELIYSDGTTPTTVAVNSSPYTFNVSPSTTTTYTVTSLKDVSCSALPGDMTGSAVVTVNPRPTSVLSGSPTVCSGSAATLNVILTGTAPWQISYSDGVTINTVTALSSPYNLVVTPTITSTYTITALTDARCSAQAGDMTGSALVTVNPRPTSVISGGATICNGETTTITFNLTGTAPWQLTYSNGTTPTTVTVNSSPHTIDVTPTATTTYTVTGLSDANCSALAGDMTGTAIVTVNNVVASLSISAPIPGGTVICAGTPVTFNASASGGLGAANYQFYVSSQGATPVQSGASSVYTTSTLQNNDVVFVRITDLNGCVDDSDPLTITVNPNPAVSLTITSAGGNVICQGSSVEFTATPGFVNYVFSVDGVLFDNGANNIFTSTQLNNGDEVFVIATASSNCSASSAPVITMTVNPLPVPTLVSDQPGNIACTGETVTFTAGGGSQYQFFVNGIAQGALSPVSTFTYSSTTDFNVSVRVVDANNCEAISPSINITISQPIAGLTVSANPICLGESVTFIAGGGELYEFFINGISQGVTASNLFEPTVLLQNNDLVTVTITDASGCTASHSGITMIVNAIPTALISSSDADHIICVGEGVTFTASSDIGSEFEFYINGVSQGRSTNSTFTTTGLVNGDQVSVIAYNSISNCYSQSPTLTYTVNALPTAGLTANPGTDILEGTNVVFTATGGVEYQWFVNGVLVVDYPGSSTYSSSTLANGDVVSVNVRDVNGCATTATLTMLVFDNAIPLTVLVSADGYCSTSTGVTIFINNPQSGINYELFRVPGSESLGIGIVNGSRVEWNNVKNLGVATEVYRVEGFNPGVPSVRVDMSNTVSVTEYALPVVYNMSPTGTVKDCNGGAGYEIKLENSETGITYELYINGNPSGIVESGTGSEISFGNQITIGTYTIMASVDAIGGCTQLMGGSFTIDISGGDVYTLTALRPDGLFCSGSTGVNLILSGSTAGFTYVLLRDNDILNPVTSLTGTGNALDFGFFTTQGVYSVVVDVTGCLFPMNGTVTVQEVPLPAAYDVIAGNNGYFCAGSVGVQISLSSQELNVMYQLLLDGNPIGGFVTGTTPGSPLVFPGLYNLPGVYSVRATIPDLGCESVTTINAILIADPLPGILTLQGENTFCEGGGSATLYLDNSESSVDYHLYLNGVATGMVEPGNGGQISFIVNQEGEYTVEAIRHNVNTSCPVWMAGEIEVTMQPLPEVRLYDVVNGSDCENGTLITILSAQPDISYLLYSVITNSPVPGYIVSGDGNNVSFAPLFDNGGEYYIVAESDAGCQLKLDGTILVNIPGVLTKFALIEPASICIGDDGVIIGINGSETGIDYELYLVGGDISTGNDLFIEQIAGNGSVINFTTKLYAEGEYYVVGVNNGVVPVCRIEMLNRVNVHFNPLPLAFRMSGSGFYCDGMGSSTIGLDGSESGIVYQLQYHSGGGLIPVGAPIVGSGNPLQFSDITVQGTYSVYARSPFGCTSNMNGTVNVVQKSAPAFFNVSVDDAEYCAGSSGASILLSGMEKDVTYLIQEVNTLEVTSVIGWVDSSEPIVLASMPLGTYSVTATWGGDACHTLLTPTPILIAMSPAPVAEPIITVTENIICAGASTLVQVVNVEPGLLYDLVIGGIEQGLIINSDDAAVEWSVSDADLYEVIAYVNGYKSCALTSNSILIVVNPAPQAFDVVPVDEVYCPGEPGVFIGLSSSQSDVFYELIDTATDLRVDYYIPVAAEVGQPFFFRNRQLEGTYQVLARFLTGGCIIPMNNVAYIHEDADANCVPLVAIADTAFLTKGDVTKSINIWKNDQYNENLDILNNNLLFTIRLTGVLDNGNSFKTYGDVKINQDGTIDYTKVPGFFGKDYVEYKVQNTQYPERYDSAIVMIMVGNKEIGEDGALLIPNAISPNGDNYNDKFVILGFLEHKTINPVTNQEVIDFIEINDENVTSHLEIFNRWGTRVYRSTGNKYLNDWDGKAGQGAMVSFGSDLPNGTYFYIFNVTFNLNNKTINKEYNGYIELRR